MVFGSIARGAVDLCTIIGKNRFNKKHVATTAPTGSDGKSDVSDPAASFEKVEAPAAEDAAAAPDAPGEGE